MNKTFAVAAAALLSAAPAASAGERLPLILASASPAFDVACIDYYAAGNNPNVSTEYGIPEILCTCLADYYRDHGLGVDALEFFARSYSEDLTTFISEYPEGDAWMEQSFTAETMCTSG
jgi:hypothetical protein